MVTYTVTRYDITPSGTYSYQTWTGNDYNTARGFAQGEVKAQAASYGQRASWEWVYPADRTALHGFQTIRAGQVVGRVEITADDIAAHYAADDAEWAQIQRDCAAVWAEAAELRRRVGLEEAV